ncbi:PDZ domain-containing protein [Rubripirellula reticaptiva]|uniref:PDZ domain-containing protein n=1 Tax=Rubripirellula reticaptiva TaxID=2528013 RepID=A0A5C6F8R0_9BACT|nr:PDZ domain-containing protein [Rubripirellula reticaptiva]TWU57705.1 hypothetical protein Poly59_06130 [Rubripirellula reticaptiva]
MKRFFIAAALLTVTATTLPAQNDPLTAIADNSIANEWGMALTEVPELLRMHLPLLRPDTGMVIESVTAGSPAAEMRLRAGDILTEVDQNPVRTSADLGHPNPRIGLMVIRRGIPEMLVAGGEIRRMPMPRWNNRFPANQANRGVMGGGSSAVGSSPGTRQSASSSVSSSVSGDGESVSVSQSGNQVSLDIASSNPNIGRVRLSGTIAEIQEQLQNGDLTDDVKAAVRRALRGAR